MELQEEPYKESFTKSNEHAILKKKSSVEDVVNQVAEKPTFMYIALMLGLMSFNITCAVVAYFPNFGGYVPYTDWRCLPTSRDCYNRTREFLDKGWQNWTGDEPVFIDSRCSIKLKKFNFISDPPYLHLYEDEDSHLGSITFDISDTNNQKITVISKTECESDRKSCTKDFVFDLGTDLEKLDCKLTFARSTWLQNDTVFDCGSDPVSLSDTEGVLSVILRVKYVKLESIGELEFHCPDEEQYNRDNLCGTGDKRNADGQLMVNQDFYWNTRGRTSFSIDWNLYCDREYLGSMIKSIYFGGAWLGLFAGGALYDVIGRKKGALVGYCVVIVACFANAASPSIEFLFVCRFFQGFGVFLGFTGMYVLMLEYTAVKYRALANTVILLLWAVGYLTVTLTGYLIYSWHWLAATPGFFYLVFHLIPLLVTPESPGFLLVSKRDEEGAKVSLKFLMKLNNSSLDINSVELEHDTDDTEEPSFMETMKDFWRYKEMLMQLAIQMWLWMVAAFIYYGFSFSWGSLGSNIYVSYLFAAIGEVIAYSVLTIPLEYWGRKPSHIMMFLVGSASFIIAMIPWKIGGSFTLEQLSSLIGSMFVSAVFGFIYLYTIELSPISHRGRICSLCSFSARIGSFCGTYVSLMFAWSKRGTFIIFAVLSGLAGLATFRLPDTTGVLTPSSAEEVCKGNLSK